MQIIKTEFNFESPELTEEERIEAAARYVAARYGFSEAGDNDDG